MFGDIFVCHYSGWVLLASSGMEARDAAGRPTVLETAHPTGKNGLVQNVNGAQAEKLMLV